MGPREALFVKLLWPLVSFSVTFLFIPCATACGILSWLTVSFSLHVRYTISYRIVSFFSHFFWGLATPSAYVASLLIMRVDFLDFFQGLKLGVSSGCLGQTSIFEIIMIDDVTLWSKLEPTWQVYSMLLILLHRRTDDMARYASCWRTC